MAMKKTKALVVGLKEFRTKTKIKSINIPNKMKTILQMYDKRTGTM
jgi:hypothetical protein